MAAVALPARSVVTANTKTVDTTDVNIQTQHSPFLALPQEICDKVYAFAFERPKIIVSGNRSKTRCSVNFPLVSSRTCRVLYEETSEYMDRHIKHTSLLVQIITPPPTISAH